MTARSNPPILNAPLAVRWLTGITVLIHVFQAIAPDPVDSLLFELFGLFPARYGAPANGAIDTIALVTMPFGHMLLHADWMHLIINMAFLLAFGSAIGRRMGPAQFLILYVLCGLAGALLWIWLYPTSTALLIGASGAISGMMGAAARVSIWPPHRTGSALPFWRRSTVITFVVIWLVLNIVFGVLPIMAPGDAGGIAWQAHLGGFIAGFFLISSFDGRGRIDPFVPYMRY